MKLYNVEVRVVDLVWADSEEDAIARVEGHLDKIGYDYMPDGASAFVSEPVEQMGWAGE